MNTIIIQNTRSIIIASLAALAITACDQSNQGNEENEHAAASITRDAAVPITTTSDKSRDLYLEGRALLDDLYFVEANEKFTQAVAEDDGFAMGYFMQAATSTTAADFFAALNKAEECAGNASEGEQLYITAAVAGANGDQAGQEATLRSLIKLHPKDERTHNQFANFLIGQQDFEGAIKHYGHAIKIAPDFASAHNSLGYAHRSADDLDGARAAFEEYVKLRPDQANPYDSLAELLMEMGDYDASVTNYRKALEIKPSFAASYAGISINHSLKGEADEAQAAAAEMLGAARNFAERQGAMFRSVTSHLFASDPNAAIAVSETMMAEAAAEGNHAAMGGVAEYMGDIMMASGNAAKAEEHFDVALEHRLQADINDAAKVRAKRAHIFKTAITSMMADDGEAAASRTAEYLAVAATDGTSFEKRRAHELSAYLAMFKEENVSAAAHFDNASQLNPIVLYWAARVHKDLGNLDRARDLADRAANRNTLSGNLPFFRAGAVTLLAELSGE